MTRHWTFGEKLGAGFFVVVGLALVMGGISVYGLRTVVDAKDHVISVEARNIADGEWLGLASARRVASVRGYLLTKQDSHLGDLRQYRGEFQVLLKGLRDRMANPEGLELLNRIAEAERIYREESDKVIALKRADAPIDTVVREFDERLAPRRARMNQAIDSFLAWEEKALEDKRQAASATASSATNFVVATALIVVASAAGIAWALTRILGSQIGTAVNQVQSSSAELQAAASQQAAGAKQQAIATAEITTTINELVVTARQIAESAQGVAEIAGETAAAARAGERTVRGGDEAIGTIRRQVDAIVTHMLELGRKSQQIGAVLEIVSELAEQTNILAINATIEAAGAGEAGGRFSAVAQEIRKLADRVADSTREIRGLIDDVRGSVNTTIMTTEAGTKAVENGGRQFASVAAAFDQIARLVATTTDAAREIELSTRQQTTGVAQVDSAVASIAQTSRETASSTTQTLQAASQLSGLSDELARLVRRGPRVVRHAIGTEPPQRA